MADQKLMIAARNKKGQIGYLSEGLSLPEFADLFRSRDGVQVLVDYSPVIEALYALRQAKSSEGILVKYNVLFNFWRDAKTYKKESLKVSKSEEVIRSANSLINELQPRLKKSEMDMLSKWHSPTREFRQAADAIKRDADLYMDSLLYFVHSKATLDIESFKGESVLSGYGKFLHDLVHGIYARLLASGQRSDCFLKFIAFEQPDELQHYLNLEGQGETPDQFLARMIRKESRHTRFVENEGHHQEVSIRFTNFSNEFASIVLMFRDLLYRISSVNAFLAKLREGTYEWDDSFDTVVELGEEIRLLK